MSNRQVNIDNVNTIKYRKDCFAQNSLKTYHLREHATGTIGTRAIQAGYSKITTFDPVIMPDTSEIVADIGHNPNSADPENPIIADKLILCGEFQDFDVFYNKLIFDKPALCGLDVDWYSYANTDKVLQSGTFTLLDRLDCSLAYYVGEPVILATGKTYYSPYISGNPRYQSFTNDYFDRLDNAASNTEAFNVGINRNAPQYDHFSDEQYNNIEVFSSSYEIMTRYTYMSRPSGEYTELQNVINTYFEYGGVLLKRNHFDWQATYNSQVSHKRHYHSYLHTTGSSHREDAFYNFIIPFVSADERNAAKSVLYTMTQSEIIAING